MSSFQQIFGFSGEGEPDEEPQPAAWFTPPHDELGVSVHQGVVIGRSERAVVALQRVTAYSSGLSFDFLAVARGLRQTEANRLFHEQHVLDAEEGPADGFLRVGIELADGTRVSNLGASFRHLWRSDAVPDGPFLIPSGGGGGSAGAGRVAMSPGYWLWPLPPPGSLTIFVEWPALDVPLSEVAIDADPLREAAARSLPVWDAES